MTKHFTAVQFYGRISQMKTKLSQAERTRVIIDVSSSQYQHLYNIMCSQEQIIDTLNESDDFDPQTFDNLFDAICNAKETYLP